MFTDGRLQQPELAGHYRQGQVVLQDRGLHGLALAKYREALALAPDDVPARLGLAMTLLETGRLAEAETEFRAALDARASG